MTEISRRQLFAMGTAAAVAPALPAAAAPLPDLRPVFMGWDLGAAADASAFVLMDHQKGIIQLLDEIVFEHVPGQVFTVVGVSRGK